MADKKQKINLFVRERIEKAPIILMEPVLFTSVTEVNVENSKPSSMKLIVEWVGIFNNLNPWSTDFTEIKNKIIHQAKWN